MVSTISVSSPPNGRWDNHTTENFDRLFGSPQPSPSKLEPHVAPAAPRLRRTRRSNRWRPEAAGPRAALEQLRLPRQAALCLASGDGTDAKSCDRVHATADRLVPRSSIIDVIEAGWEAPAAPMIDPCGSVRRRQQRGGANAVRGGPGPPGPGRGSGLRHPSIAPRAKAVS